MMVFLLGFSTLPSGGTAEDGGVEPLASGPGDLDGHRSLDGPIAIDSDTELIAFAAHAGWAGNGTATAPYIVEGYEINASSGTFCIYVGNVSLHFVVKDNRLTQAGGYSDYWKNAGVAFDNVTNGSIEGNALNRSTRFGEMCGIYLKRSTAIVTDNTIYRCRYGIYLEGSNANITNNTMLDSELEAIITRTGGRIQICNNSMSQMNASANLDFRGT